jgi:hypothetical protein
MYAQHPEVAATLWIIGRPTRPSGSDKGGAYSSDRALSNVGAPVTSKRLSPQCSTRSLPQGPGGDVMLTTC